MIDVTLDDTPAIACERVDAHWAVQLPCAARSRSLPRSQTSPTPITAAVLRSTDLSPGEAAQTARAYLDEAIAACQRVLRRPTEIA